MTNQFQVYDQYYNRKQQVVFLSVTFAIISNVKGKKETIDHCTLTAAGRCDFSFDTRESNNLMLHCRQLLLRICLEA